MIWPANSMSEEYTPAPAATAAGPPMGTWNVLPVTTKPVRATLLRAIIAEPAPNEVLTTVPVAADEIAATKIRVETLLKHRVHPYPPADWPAVPWPPV